MTYLIEMTEAEWEDINKISVSKMRMMLYRGRPAVHVGTNTVLNGDLADTYAVRQTQPARKESIVLFEPLPEREWLPGGR